MGPTDNPGVFGWTPEEGNLLYVAVTRAKQGLDITECEAVTLTAGYAVQDESESTTEEGRDLFDFEKTAQPPAMKPAPIEPEEKENAPAQIGSLLHGEWSRLFTLPTPSLTLQVAVSSGVVTAVLTDTRTRTLLASAAAPVSHCQIRTGAEIATLIVGDAAFSIEPRDASSIDSSHSK